MQGVLPLSRFAERSTVLIISLLVLLTSVVATPVVAEDTPTDGKQVRKISQEECEFLLQPKLPKSWVEKMKAKKPAPAAQRLKDVVQTQGFTRTALNQNLVRSHNENYTVLNPIGPVTDQKSSGRCWIFAGLNMVRSHLLAAGKVPPNFEFSENYIYFFSMLEQANRYLEETMVYTFPGGPAKGIGGRGLRSVMSPRIHDGGFFEYFTFLVEKYGLVPKSAMPETISSERSAVLLEELQNHLASVAADMLRASQKSGKLKTQEQQLFHMLDMRKLKERGMEGIWTILSTHLGDPPSTINWRVNTGVKSVSGTRFVDTQSVDFTPLEFSRLFAEFDPNDYVVVSSFPNQKNNRLYEQPGTGVGMPGQGENPHNVRYLNVAMERMEELTVKAIESGEPVWYGADVSKDVDHGTGIMHPKVFDRDGVYGMTAEEQATQLTRRQRSFMSVIRLNHAMVLTGFDRPDPNGPVIKFRNENSWGDKVGSRGVYHLYRDWFHEYVFEVVVHKRHLSDVERAILAGPADRQRAEMY